MDTRACYHLICNLKKYKKIWNNVVLAALVTTSGYLIILTSKNSINDDSDPLGFVSELIESYSIFAHISCFEH